MSRLYKKPHNLDFLFEKNMKSLLVYLFLIFGFLNTKAQKDIIIDHQNLEWYLDFKKAQASSATENKPILLYFTGSDWCGACKLLEQKYFSKTRFKSLAKNFILYEADFPKNKLKVNPLFEEKNIALKNKFNITAFPTIIIVDKKENVLGRVVGYRNEKTSKIYSSLFTAILNSIL